MIGPHWLRWRRTRAVLPRHVASDTLAMPGEAWAAREDFLRERDGQGHERLKAQWQVAVHLPTACAFEGLSGLCVLCAARRRFGRPGDSGSFDVREGLACEACGTNARMRHALGLLLDGLDRRHARVYLTEQASPGFVWLQHHIAHAEGSEFGLDEVRRRHLASWYARLGGEGPLHEADVTALAREAASLDAIGCFDVLEHVPDYRAALREFARVLAPGGRLVLTLPFLETEQTTLVRALVGPDGAVEHLLPPEIHGDPVSGGVLCFYHFGWDLLDALREAGFRHAEWVRSFVPEYAIYGLWSLRATR